MDELLLVIVQIGKSTHAALTKVLKLTLHDDAKEVEVNVRPIHC